MRLLRRLIEMKYRIKRDSKQMSILRDSIDELKTELQDYKHDEEMKTIIRHHLGNRYQQLNDMISDMVEGI